MGILEDALKDRAYHLGKNLEDLTPAQIAEVEANPEAYLPEGYFGEAETPEEVSETEVGAEAEAETEPEAEVAETVTEPETEPEPEPKPKSSRRKKA